MGIVWRVHDILLDMPVALKVVRAEYAADERFRKLFRLEIRISALHISARTESTSSRTKSEMKLKKREAYIIGSVTEMPARSPA